MKLEKHSEKIVKFVKKMQEKKKDMAVYPEFDGEHLDLPEVEQKIKIERKKIEGVAKILKDNFIGKLFVVFHSKAMREAVRNYEVGVWNKFKNCCCSAFKEKVSILQSLNLLNLAISFGKTSTSRRWSVSNYK